MECVLTLILEPVCINNALTGFYHLFILTPGKRLQVVWSQRRQETLSQRTQKDEPRPEPRLTLSPVFWGSWGQGRREVLETS